LYENIKPNKCEENVKGMYIYCEDISGFSNPGIIASQGNAAYLHFIFPPDFHYAMVYEKIKR
jgi:hypothetical protein